MPPHRRAQFYYNTPYPIVEYIGHSQRAEKPFPNRRVSNDSTECEPLTFTDSSQSSPNFMDPTVAYCPERHDQLTNHSEVAAYDHVPPATTARSLERMTSRQKPQISHPYDRLQAEQENVKRRRNWTHALEDEIFSPYEISTIGAPKRREIYISSLEAYIDRLHVQLIKIGLWPVEMSELEQFKGLNSKVAKSMVAGLHHDALISERKFFEMQRANINLQKTLSIVRQPEP